MDPTSSIDPAEVAKFEAMAAEWWDRSGKFEPLHAMNPVRLQYIARQLTAEFGRDPNAPLPLHGLRLLDIGCGGGLVCEPMRRLGADVVGADASPESIGVAKLHAARHGLDIDYRKTSAEALVADKEHFDAVLALEIIEHVPEPAAFLTTCKDLMRPSGILIVSTLNRTAKSWALGVVAAERVLRWLPPGTHDWSKFVAPGELDALLVSAGLDPVDSKGMVYQPLADRWSLSDTDFSINYIAAAVRQASG